jgi:hypothetical protein
VAAPERPRGTPARRQRENQQEKGDKRNPPGNKDKGGGASEPGSDGKGNKKPKVKGLNKITNMESLNPPFDPRMRRIGSPLNLTNRIKRGWIQSEEDNLRVNFLFNPSSLDLSHTIDPSMVRNPDQAPSADVMDPDYPTIGSSTGVKLLYDRTYELFSAPKDGKMGFANKYGVWADVAAWYVFLGLLPEMPDSWENSIITDPPTYRTSYLFVGPKMVYYGWVTGISVAYSHWNQEMVPARCAVDVSFQLLPSPSGPAPLQGEKELELQPLEGLGWLSDLRLN